MKSHNFLKFASIMFAATLASGCVANCSHTKEAEAIQPVQQEVPQQEIKKQEEKKPEPASVVSSKPVEKKTEPAPAPKKEEPKKEEPKKAEAKPVSLTTPKPDPKPAVEAKKEEPKKPEPAEDEEYNRSVAQITNGKTIDHDTFNKDKEAVLALIGDLDNVMQEQNYDAWLTYLDTESINYWSRRNNLQKAQKRLPVKGLSLTSLQDYFKYVFIPSRQGNKMDEIRYETERSVKAVQIRKNDKGEYVGDTVFYYLRKIDGQWKLHLPQM